MSQESSLAQLIHDLYLVWMSLAPLLLVGAVLSCVIHVSLPADFIRKALSGRWGVIKAVLIGVPLPLCSCGVIPAGLGLKRDGASDGATIGFLISTPQTGLDSILVSGSLLGLPFAIYKVIAAAVTGIVGGLLTEQLSDSKSNNSHLTAKNLENHGQAHNASKKHSGLKEALIHFDEVIEPIWLWVIVGVIASVAIQHLMPSESISSLSGFSLLLPYLATLAISLPLYVCATASVPIAAALVAQGFPIGVALIFLMAGPATNIATLGAVFKGLGKKTFVIYLSTLIIGSVLFALSLDLLLAWQAPSSIFMTSDHHHTFAWWEQILAIMLGLVFVKYFGRSLSLVTKKFINNLVFKTSSSDKKTKQVHLRVSGLSCQSCVRRLEGFLLNDQSIINCKVSDSLDQLLVNGEITYEQVKYLVEEAGFEAHELIEDL